MLPSYLRRQSRSGGRLGVLLLLLLLLPLLFLLLPLLPLQLKLRQWQTAYGRRNGCGCAASVPRYSPCPCRLRLAVRKGRHSRLHLPGGRRGWQGWRSAGCIWPCGGCSGCIRCAGGAHAAGAGTAAKVEVRPVRGWQLAVRQREQQALQQGLHPQLAGRHEGDAVVAGLKGKGAGGGRRIKTAEGVLHNVLHQVRQLHSQQHDG